VATYAEYLRSAERRGIDFNLTCDQFIEIVGGECIYCGDVRNIGVDRIDSEVGYVIENAVPCCAHCNERKGRCSLEQFAYKAIEIRIVRYMRTKGIRVSVNTISSHVD